MVATVITAASTTMNRKSGLSHAGDDIAEHPQIGN